MPLTQAQLNAGSIISALATCLSVNIDPKYGYGQETLDLVREHLNFWDTINGDNQVKIFFHQLFEGQK